MTSWPHPGFVLGTCLLTMAGCAVDLSPTTPVLGVTKLEFGDKDHYELQVAAPGDLPVLITVTSPDVDVRVAASGPGDMHAPTADAPNRRMGVESLLLEPPYEQGLSIRIERNDNQEAHGFVTVVAVALPVSTDADRRRLEAARLESAACLTFGDLNKGTETAAAFAAAADLHSRNEDDRQAGIALLHAAGTQYTRLADWRAAATLAALASRKLDHAGVPAAAAFALRLEGAALDLLANAGNSNATAHDQLVARARQRLTEAAERFETLGLAYEAGYALNYRGVSFQDSGEREQARADFLKALDLFRRARDKPAQALSLQSLATLSHEDGRLADAMREFDQALALIPREQDAENYAHTLHNSARPLQVLGRFDEAIARYYEAGRILHQLGDRNGEARALHGMGTTFWHAGEPERAKELLRLAIGLRSATGAKREQALSMIVLGQIERDAGNIDAAITLHEQAAALASTQADRAISQLALAQDQEAAGDLALARDTLEAMLRLELPATHRYRGLAMTELGDIESREGDTQAAADAFARALSIHRVNGSELEQAQVLYRRAAAMMDAGNTQSVLTDTSDALALFDEIGLQGMQAERRASFRATYRGVIELRIAALLAEADTAQQKENSIQAQRLLRAALVASDQSRAQLLKDVFHEAPAGTLARRREIYDLLAGKRQQKDRLLDASETDAKRVAALEKDIALLRAEASLTESRIEGSPSFSSGSPELGTNVLIQAIPQNTRIAEYFLGKSRGWLFEVRDGMASVHPLRNLAEIDRLARRLHASWRSVGMSPGDRLAIGRQLAELVLGPLGSSTPAGKFQIIPDGALHLVPMAFLAQQAWPAMRPGTAVVVPSLSATRAESRVQESVPHKWLAVIADPVYTADDPRIQLHDGMAPAQSPIRLAGDVPLTRNARDLGSLRRLPSTAAEAGDLIALVNRPSETLALIGLDANITRVTMAPLKDYRIVHFATHAMADSQDPALAMLALSRWDANGNSIDGALRFYDVTQMHLNADLVVLSGCDTALGREVAGEAPIGLAQAFLRAGAHSVVSTLWQVPDTSTAVLMREFYRQLLRNNQDAAVALQLAQDRVRGQARWSDPYFWAGFQLVSLASLDRSNNQVARLRESP